MTTRVERENGLKNCKVVMIVVAEVSPLLPGSFLDFHDFTFNPLMMTAFDAVTMMTLRESDDTQRK